MHPIARLLAIGVVFVGCAIAWVGLGEMTEARTDETTARLEGAVAELWGRPHAQEAPKFVFEWTAEQTVERTETIQGVERRIVTTEDRLHTDERPAASSDVAVDLRLDPRQKGLVWYSLYDVDFEGAWTYTHAVQREGTLRLDFAFPDAAGIYDQFRFVVDGVDRTSELQPTDGRMILRLPIEPGQKVALGVGYRSRGMSEWRYVPSNDVARLESFKLGLTTDFAQIDFPARTMSPSTKARTEAGWRLDWAFDQVVTGFGVGMVMPKRLQPGGFAAELAFSAPISLFFFFLVIFVLDLLRGINMHPVNYLFLGASFFAFHLLFAYSVDHIAVVPAFIIASAVSVLLLVTYLRLVVSNRFAFVESGLAQAVYLVGFSLAHFWSGFTGLTVTVLAIFTLFLLMQWTGRVRWSETLGTPTQRPTIPAKVGG